MATSSVQGFVKSANLKENELDRQALNNLGTAPIADDISLFINNLKNTDSLYVSRDEYDDISGLVTIVNLTNVESELRSGAFTNGDRVSISELVVELDGNGDPVRDEDGNINIIETGNLIVDNLYIANSDGETIFGFATDEELKNAFTFDPQTPFFIVVRKTAVLLENIELIAPQQNETNLNNEINSDDTGTDSGTSSNAPAQDGDRYVDGFNEIYEYLDIAKFQAKSKFVNDKDVAADVDFAMEGMFTINDPADTIISEGVTTNSPGLYITDPTSPVTNIQKIRAFSDVFNPWEQTVEPEGNALTTQSVDVTAGVLKMNNGLDIVGITTLGNSGTVDSNTFTHKIKVNIDGVDYYLCLNKT